jgi:hypothetical protein
MDDNFRLNPAHIRLNVRGLPQSWNGCFVCPATEANKKPKLKLISKTKQDSVEPDIS